MPLAFHQVDAFTAEAFAGNPACVILMPAWRDDAWMQAVAREFNLSETAFLRRREDGDFDLRWLTPTIEVTLCGHATLASAHVLFETGIMAGRSVARFHTRSGLLTARRDGSWIVLDFPSKKMTPVEPPAGLLEALGVRAVAVASNDLDFLVEVANEGQVLAVRPDHGRLRSLKARGVMVTSLSNTGDWDFVSRYFAPGSGIDEDPVTGSAHCALGPYWGAKLGRDSFVAHQASARGGILRVLVKGDRVELAGQAVTVMRGELFH